ncbi:MAG: DUF3275 family protein [Betaproteobacteria bacterium]|nr:DUF3275 family protein [Betaproteobacteria bacterium]
MIEIPGSLAVKQIHGKKGTFCVGELTTDIGTFKVKEKALDQYDPGVYHGSFVVAKIYQESYLYYGRYYIELRADLADIRLDTAESNPAESDVPAEPDPVDTAPSEKQSPVADRPEAAPVAADPAHTPAADRESPDQASDRDLFGEDIAALMTTHQAIKLDPTVDRLVFRAQRDRLKTLGYRWEATLQQWLKPQAKT